MSNELYIEHEASDATEQATPKFDDIELGLEPLVPAHAAEGTRDNVVLPPLPESWPEPKLPPLPTARMRAALPPPRRAIGTAGMGHPIVVPPPAPPAMIIEAPQLAEADIATEYYERPKVGPFVKRSTLAIIGGAALLIGVCVAARFAGSSDSDAGAAKTAAVAVDRGEKNEPTEPTEKKALVASDSVVSPGSVVSAGSAPSANSAVAVAPTPEVAPTAAHADVETPAVEAVASPAPPAVEAVASPAPVRHPSDNAAPHAAPSDKPATHVAAATPSAKPATHVATATPSVASSSSPAKAAAAAHAAAPKTVAAMAPPTPAGPPGILAISTKPPCEIYVDGKSTHLSTPQKALKLPPGKHELVLVNNALKIRESRQIQIAPSAQTKLVLDLQRK